MRGRRRPTIPGRGGPRRSRAPVLLAPILAGLSLLQGGCALPRWPVDGPLTSPFGLRFRGWAPDLHRGVDIYVPEGTEVRAVAGGRVRFAGTMGGYGEVVWLEHPGGILSVYGHLSSIRLRTGDPVRSRDVLGLSGSSGNAAGPHLHFEIWRRGRQVDPVPLLGGFPGG